MKSENNEEHGRETDQSKSKLRSFAESALELFLLGTFFVGISTELGYVGRVVDANRESIRDYIIRVKNSTDYTCYKGHASDWLYPDEHFKR